MRQRSFLLGLAAFIVGLGLRPGSGYSRRDDKQMDRKR